MEVEELVASLMRNPLLAYKVTGSLLESPLIGPWEHASGIENSYRRTYIRKHVSGHIVGTVAKTIGGAVWWTTDVFEHAGSLAAARAEIDRELLEAGFTLTPRGKAQPWVWDTIAWIRRDESGNRLAKVWGSSHGKYEIFEFAFSDYTTSLVRDTTSVEKAKLIVAQTLQEHGWAVD